MAAPPLPGSEAKACLEEEGSERIWHRIAACLHGHELLGRLAMLSANHAALLMDEGCWRTLAMPAGPKRVGYLLWLMLREERELWAPLLHQVQLLDLNLQGCTAGALGHLRDLLLHSLALDGGVRRVRVCRIPVRPAPDPEAPQAERKFNRNDMTLVNPIAQNAAAPQLFLLDALELGQLRWFMARFRYFRLRPSASAMAVDLLAEHGPPPGDPATDGAARDPVEALALTELGALASLPDEAFGGGFDGWLKSILPRYKLLMSSWE
uniref:Uncharacterized protein n=1 Tax=Pyrodinium bahamense TaxID=73915 RepID=A0A7S0B5S2_9DINO